MKTLPTISREELELIRLIARLMNEPVMKPAKEEEKRKRIM